MRQKFYLQSNCLLAACLQYFKTADICWFVCSFPKTFVFLFLCLSFVCQLPTISKMSLLKMSFDLEILLHPTFTFYTFKKREVKVGIFIPQEQDS